MTSTPEIVGLVGPIAAGKETVIDELLKFGFKAFFLGDRTREEADRRGLPHGRSILQNMGNELRAKFGNEILVKRTEKLFKPSNDKIVIDGIRNVGEIAYLRKKYNARVLGVNASVEARSKFIAKRAGDADPTTEEEFKNAEQRDRGIGEDSHGQQVDACLALCDVVIENNATKKEFARKIKLTISILNL